MTRAPRKGLLAVTALTLASFVISAALSAGLHAGGKAQQTPVKVVVPVPNGAAGPVAALTPDAYQETVNKYCVTCHNQKARIPAGAPLALDAANLKDPGANPEIWE